MHIHENEMLLVKFPRVCMECNGIKYSGCRRWEWLWYSVCLNTAWLQTTYTMTIVMLTRDFVYINCFVLWSEIKLSTYDFSDLQIFGKVTVGYCDRPALLEILHGRCHFPLNVHTKRRTGNIKYINFTGHRTISIIWHLSYFAAGRAPYGRRRFVRFFCEIGTTMPVDDLWPWH